MNTLITILIDIGFYLHENWKVLSLQAVATFIALTVGKRWGIRFAVNYIYRAIGIRKKEIDLRMLAEEVRWTRRHVERMVGEKWSVERGNLENRTHGKHSLYLWIMKYLARPVGSFTVRGATVLYTLLRRMNMNKFKSRKFWMAVISGVLVILNDGMDIGIDNQTVMAFAGIVMSFIFGEAYVDSKRTGGKNDAQHFGDSGPAV